jgi:hypothetical protein
MKKQVNSQSYFQTLNIIYFAQTLMMLAFSAVTAFLMSSNETPQPDRLWHTVIPVVIIISLSLAYVIFRMMIRKIKSTETLKSKMPQYSRAVLIRSALLEMPALLSAIVAYLTGQLYYLGVPVFIVLIFLVLRPTRNSVALDLNLSPKERAMLDDPQAIISEADQGM